MKDVFKKALDLLVGDDISLSSLRLSKKRPLKKLTERELIQLESEIGSKLFGSIPAGHRREFFNHDAKNWIWHEEWIDGRGMNQSLTTRYEIQDRGILKVRVGYPYEFIDSKELENLVAATQMYYERIKRDIYNKDSHTDN